MIKRILQEVKEYRKASFLAPIFMVGEVVLEISLPFLMSFIIDKGVSQGDMTEATKYGVIMIVAAFGSLFCGAMSGKYAAYASALPRICAEQCSTIFRISRFIISINFLQPVW